MTRLKLYTAPNSPVFMPGKSDWYHVHDMFAWIEKDKWEFVQDIRHADVIPSIYYKWNNAFVNNVNKLVHKDQIVLAMNLFHNDNYMTKRWFREADWDMARKLKCRTLIVHNNILDNDDPKYICYDILFNRQKYYFFDMDKEFDPRHKVWTWNSKPEFYSFGPIEKHLSPESKKILCLNRLYWSNDEVRNQKTLRELLKQKFQGKHDVFLSDPSNNIFFYPNNAEHNNIKVLDSGGTWYPAADFYYNNSYVNVYIESVTHSGIDNDMVCVTEKTFDPMIKGNFVLPFSSYKFIDILKRKYGFRFPDWIDYSYDDIEDLDCRAEKYMESVNKLYDTPIEVLHDYYLRDRDILEYNRQLIKRLPYSSLYDSVVRSRKLLHWD